MSDSAGRNKALMQRVKNEIDVYLERMKITPPPFEDDPADMPYVEAKCVSPLRRLNLHEADVSTVIWATGFTGDFSWVHLPVFDDQHKPIRKRGISPERGLYYVGFPWLNSRKSGVLHGIAEDAQYIADAIRDHLA